MRTDPGIAGRIAAHPWVRETWRRRIVIAVLVVLLAILALYPRSYRAAMTMTPTDPNSLGLSGALGQLGAYTSVFGSQAALDISLKVARGTVVRDKAAAELKLVEQKRFANPVEANRWLERNVDIRALRGGLIQIESKQRSPDEALRIVTAFATATRAQLAAINRQQTNFKRNLLQSLVDRSQRRFFRARDAYDAFRRQTRYTQPTQTVETIGARIPQLELTLKDLQAQLRSASAFATPENYTIRQIQAQIASTESELAEARSLTGANPFAVSTVLTQQIQLERLERELNDSYGLYISYRRFLEGTEVEDMAANANVRILENPYIDPDRQYNMLPEVLIVLILLLEIAVEAYWARPPLGADTAHLDA